MKFCVCVFTLHSKNFLYEYENKIGSSVPRAELLTSIWFPLALEVNFDTWGWVGDMATKFFLPTLKLDPKILPMQIYFHLIWFNLI